MASESHNPKPIFEGPAIYQIRVLGELDVSWSDRMENVNITRRLRSDGVMESILVGRFGDQAALTGILNTLYNLRFSLISVDCLDCN